MAKSLLETFVLRRAAIYASPGAPTDTLKRVYGTLTDGELGIVPCVEIQKWDGATNVFSIADHPILADTPTVYVNDVPTGSGWTFSASNNFESQGTVATLSFNTDQTGKRISAKCKGRLNGSSALIENLAEIIYDLLVTTHGLSFEYDSVSYMQAFLDCASLGYLGGGVVLDDADPVGLADSILKPIGSAFAGGDGKLKLFVETLPAIATPEDFFDAHECAVTLVRELDAVVNDLQLEGRFNWRKRAFASLEKQFDYEATDSDAQSILEYGTRTVQLEAPWLRTSTALNAAIDTLLALRKRPRWDVTLAMTGHRAHLQQPADIVGFTGRGQLPGGAGVGEAWDRRLMRVRQVDVPWDGSGVTLRGYDLERNWWIVAYLADGTYLANASIRAGGNAVAA